MFQNQTETLSGTEIILSCPMQQLSITLSFIGSSHILSDMKCLVQKLSPHRMSFLSFFNMFYYYELPSQATKHHYNQEKV